ncbi:MAG: hypothetical protein KDI37_04400, partial [Xanthomonadales bacterium]|nr:hypothetical protein [Xanthomonadales bacterium]
LLADELGLAVDRQQLGQAADWLAQLLALRPNDATAGPLLAWQTARAGQPPPSGRHTELGLPAQWRILLARGELPPPQAMRVALADLPADLWWAEPLIARLARLNPLQRTSAGT